MEFFDKINLFCSSRRNPVIADLFHRMKFMERRGSGLRKIIDETSKLSGYDENYKPEFISSATDFRVILKNVNYVNVGVNVGVKLSKTQKLILKEITVNTKITADELSKIISVLT